MTLSSWGRNPEHAASTSATTLNTPLFAHTPCGLYRLLVTFALRCHGFAGRTHWNVTIISAYLQLRGEKWLQDLIHVVNQGDFWRKKKDSDQTELRSSLVDFSSFLSCVQWILKESFGTKHQGHCQINFQITVSESFANVANCCLCLMVIFVGLFSHCTHHSIIIINYCRNPQKYCQKLLLLC